jgi:hypothetical protein
LFGGRACLPDRLLHVDCAGVAVCLSNCA